MNIQLNRRYKLTFNNLSFGWEELPPDPNRYARLQYVPTVERGPPGNRFAIVPVEWRDPVHGALVTYRAGVDALNSPLMLRCFAKCEAQFYLSEEGDRIVLAFYKGGTLDSVTSTENCNG